MTTATKPKWADVPSLVEQIMAARIVTKTNLGANGSEITTTRSMRFREFAAEIKMPYQLAYRCIRVGIEPESKWQTKIMAWCEKHRAAITK